MGSKITFNPTETMIAYIALFISPSPRKIPLSPFESTDYHLEDLWMERGYNSLLRKPCGGRNLKLNDEQLKELELILNSKNTILVNDILKIS